MIANSLVTQQPQGIKSSNQAFSCSSSGYSSQSLSECDTNSNKNSNCKRASSDTTDSLLSTQHSSPVSSTHQIDQIQTPSSMLLLETTSSLSCIRTSTPTNPINSTTLDSNNNNLVYKSLSSECCYSDTISSRYSSSNPPHRHHRDQSNQQSISQPHQLTTSSMDYFRQISFNPTCNSSSICQQQQQSNNFYYVNNMKCFDEKLEPPYSLISPIATLESRKPKNTASFISTSTKTSVPPIQIKQHQQPQLKQEPFTITQSKLNYNYPHRLVRQNRPEIHVEKKPSKLSAVFTFVIKLLNCFNLFSIFSKSSKSSESVASRSASLSEAPTRNGRQVFTSSTSLPFSSSSSASPTISNTSIPKILLKNKNKYTANSNELAGRLYAQSVEKKAFGLNSKSKNSGAESPSSFNFVGFSNNCPVSSTPIIQQQKQQQQPVPIKSKQPVVKIKSASTSSSSKSNKLNEAAIESQFYSTTTTTNTSTNRTSEIPNHYTENTEKETYDNVPSDNSTFNFVTAPFPLLNSGTAKATTDEVEHYVTLDLRPFSVKKNVDSVRLNTMNGQHRNNSIESDLSNDSTTNYDNDLEQIAGREIFLSSSSSDLSSSSLVNSVNIYLNNFNKTSSSASNSSCSIPNSKFKELTDKKKNIHFNPMKLSDFILDDMNQIESSSVQYIEQTATNLFINLPQLQQKLSRSMRPSGPAPFYEDYLCDKEVESYFDKFDNPVYFDCYSKHHAEQFKHFIKKEHINVSQLYKNKSAIQCHQKHQNVVSKINRNQSMVSNSLQKTISRNNFYNGSNGPRQPNGESYC